MKAKRPAPRLTASEARPPDDVVTDALSHPLRVRILGWLRHQPPRTQSEVGKALALSNAAARYHLKALEGAGLVAFRGTRPGPNGITEKLYAFEPTAWQGREATGPGTRGFMLDYTLASIHEAHRKAADLIKADWRSPFVAGSVGAFATSEAVRQLRLQLDALLEEFSRRHQDPGESGASPVVFTFAVLPSRPDDAAGWAGERVFEWEGEGPQAASRKGGPGRRR